MLRFRTILYPTDFSPTAEYAFRIAASLAHSHGAKVVVLHVNPPGATPEEDEMGKELLWEEFHRLEALDPDVRDVRIETRFMDGNPVEEILRQAEDVGCDVIVMGTHGRGGLSRLLLGSVAEQVMRRARCPVMTVKPLPTSAPAATAESRQAAQV